jgi:hypothetical protein
MPKGLTEHELQKHLASIYKIGKRGSNRVVEFLFDSAKERDEFKAKLSKWRPNSSKS